MEEVQFKKIVNLSKKILTLKEQSKSTDLTGGYKQKLVNMFLNLDEKYLNRPYSLILSKALQIHKIQDLIWSKVQKSKHSTICQKTIWLINQNFIPAFKGLGFLIEKNKNFNQVKKADLIKSLNKCGINQVEHLMLQSLAKSNQEEIFKLGLNRLTSVRSLNKIINHVLQMPPMEASVLLKYIETHKTQFTTPKTSSKIFTKFKAFVQDNLEDILYHSHLDKVKSIQYNKINLSPRNQFFLLNVEKSLRNIYNIQQKNHFHHFIGNLLASFSIGKRFQFQT